jgi:hypothetical protein
LKEIVIWHDHLRFLIGAHITTKSDNWPKCRNGYSPIKSMNSFVFPCSFNWVISQLLPISATFPDLKLERSLMCILLTWTFDLTVSIGCNTNLAIKLAKGAPIVVAISFLLFSLSTCYLSCCIYLIMYRQKYSYQ